MTAALTKTCSQCHLELPIDNFRFLDKAAGKHRPECRVCYGAKYNPCVIRGARARRTRADGAAVELAARKLVADNAPVTMRQLYYLLVAADLIPKTEQTYRQLCNDGVDWREDGTIPWRHIVDNIRRRHIRYTFTGLQHALQDASDVYIRNRWEGQPEYVEVLP